MPVIASYTKAPGADLDYTLNWAGWLQAGETIASSTWAITSSQPAQTGDVVSHDNGVGGTGTYTTIWADGGVVGVQYTLANSIVTTSTPPRTDTRSILLDIEAR